LAKQDIYAAIQSEMSGDLRDGMQAIGNIQSIQTDMNTISNESLEWLKFGGFGKSMKLANLSSTNLL